MKCRILESKDCTITNGYSKNHEAVDLCKNNNGELDLDYIIAHSDGKVIFHQDGYSNDTKSEGNASYGNCVKIDHGNGYYTLYAHMKKGLPVKYGQKVKAGQRIGCMSNSGKAYGGHLHFEVWKHSERIDPTPYINANIVVNDINVGIKYTIGDEVQINGVYVSSTSTEKLKPAKTKGKITKIVEGARNPYLLENGNIGWVDDSVIVGKGEDIKYLSNKNYKGTSIVDGLNQINVDSSYNYRSKLAKVNNISNYRGTAEQNTHLLNLLKQGKLIAA